jgi:hypothetical protein
LKYAGSLLIVFGIVIIFYMKAYFFRRDRTEVSSQQSAVSGRQ